MPYNPQVLLVADLNYYAKGHFRLQALNRLGAKVEAISHTNLNNNCNGTQEHSLLFRIAWKLGVHLDTERVNKKLLNKNGLKLVGKHTTEKTWMVRCRLQMHGEDHTHITDLTNLSRRTGRSRLGKYRRQRRRRRRRRVVAIAVVTLACGLGSAYYLSNNYEAAGIVANLPIVKDLLPHLEQVVDLKMVQTWFVRIPKTSTTVLYLEKDDEAETKRKQAEEQSQY